VNRKEIEDKELVKRVIGSGDTKCFATIVSRYSGMVFSKALRLTHREELAAEITQQTFVKAYEGLECWHGQSLAPWLAAIASHTALNILDKEKRRRAKPIELMNDSEACADDKYSEEREARLSKMERAISTLPEAERRLIEMYYNRQLSTKDIAVTTGMTQANVLVKLHRIRERLKKIMENESDE